MTFTTPGRLAMLAIIFVTVSNVFTLTRVAHRTLTVRQMADFDIFYRSAQLALERQNPYRPVLDLSASQRVPAPNLNLPHTVLLMMPLAMFAARPALAIWLVVSAISAIVAIRIIFREAAIQLTPMAIAVALFLLSSAAATGAFLMSFQLSWLLWAPVTWAWALTRRGRWDAGGVLLGLLASIKPFLTLFIPVFLLINRSRAAALCGITLAACLAVGIATFGWEVFLSWVEVVRSVSWTGHIFNSSTFGYFDRLFGRGPGGVWALTPIKPRPDLGLILGAAAGLIVVCTSLHALGSRAWTDRYASAAEVDRVFAVTLTASLLATPLGWIYYEFLAAGPVVALIANQEWRRSLNWRAALLAFGAVCLTLSPRTVTAAQPNGWATASLGSAYFWGLLAFWWCVLTPHGQTAGHVDANAERPESLQL